MAAKKGHTWSHELDVIGLKFRWKREGRIALAKITERGGISGIVLGREPDNKYDPNAIMVSLPIRLMEGKQLGYIRRDSAELLAAKLDAGTLEVVSAKLLDLREDDDWNEGTLLVVFRDIVPTAKKKREPAKTA